MIAGCDISDQSRVPWIAFYYIQKGERLRRRIMSTTPASRSSAARMTRHRERRRQGTRCVTVDVNQSERDALVVRGYLSGKNGTAAPHSKRRLRRSSPISSWTYSTKPLSAATLAPDPVDIPKRVTCRRVIPRYASLPRQWLHSARDARHRGICCCRVRNSSRTCIRETLTAVGQESSIRGW